MILRDTEEIRLWATEQLDRRQSDPEYGDDTYDGAWLAGAVRTLLDILNLLDDQDA